MNRRVVAIVVLLSVFLSTLVCCSGDNDNGFKEVASVTYTVDGTKKTENSIARMSLGNAEYSSEDEYTNANSKYQVTSVGISRALTSSSKTVSSIGGFDNSDNGKYIYYRYIAWGSMGWGSVRGKDFDFGFQKYKIISEISYNYIKVKVVDDDTIIIKNSRGETTYNVSSYSITYFDD